jgi:hypothetical protein
LGNTRPNVPVVDLSTFLRESWNPPQGIVGITQKELEPTLGNIKRSSAFLVNSVLKIDNNFKS